MVGTITGADVAMEITFSDNLFKFPLKILKNYEFCENKTLFFI